LITFVSPSAYPAKEMIPSAPSALASSINAFSSSESAIFPEKINFTGKPSWM
jgi:hypothetical protein